MSEEERNCQKYIKIFEITQKYKIEYEKLKKEFYNANIDIELQELKITNEKILEEKEKLKRFEPIKLGTELTKFEEKELIKEMIYHKGNEKTFRNEE